MTYFLGMEIKQLEGEVFICQKKYAKEILKKFHMEDCKVITTPMNHKESLSKEDGIDKVDEGYFRSNGWVFNVPNYNQARYCFCCEHSLSFHALC